jgi:hypothetical protein
MKKQVLLFGAFAILALASCGKDDDAPINLPSTSGRQVTLKGDITGNRTLSADSTYLLNGFVYVMEGATLTIQPGTVIKGDKASKGTLIITRGARIMAEGTAAKPIIFTSALPAGSTSRTQGDWGGLIILGKAPINPAGGEAKIEGGLTVTPGGDEKKHIWYGGTDATDNSGILKYVRVEFAGIAVSPDNEINGLTLGGVGSGTKISYVQVYRSGDDAFEWFGGTVNCDHLVATYTWDDDFDTDFGFSGKVQFGVAQRLKNTADVSGSNGFESDNDGNGTTNTPQTRAIFSNMTIVGPIAVAGASGINANFQHGAQIRRNSSLSIINSVITGFPIGLYIDDTKVTSHKTSDNIVDGTLIFKNNIIAGNVANTKGTYADLATWFTNSNNTTLDSSTKVMMIDAYKFAPAVATPAGRPNYLLMSGSPAATGASFTGVSGFENVGFRGAFDGSNDWTQGWTSFDAENNTY